MLVYWREDQPAPGKRPLKTLERVLSKAGLGSRTDARKWIGAGRVKVNGKLIQTPDHWVDLARDKVTLDDKPVQAGEKIYLLLYKPTGYITTFKDPEGRATVYDLIQRDRRGTLGGSRRPAGSGYQRIAAAHQRHPVCRTRYQSRLQGSQDVSREGVHACSPTISFSNCAQAWR